MDPGAELVRLSNQALRRDRRRSLWQSLSKYRLAGGPRPQTRLGVGLRAWSLLAGGDGPQVRMPFGGRVRIPEALRVTPRPALPVHQGCVHCLGRGGVRKHAAPGVGVSVSTLASAGPFATGSVMRLDAGTHFDVSTAHARAFDGGGILSDRADWAAAAGTLVDAHAHLFPGTQSDLMETLLDMSFGGWGGTDNEARIDWLGVDMAAAGVSQAVVSGFLDGSLDEPASPDMRIGEGVFGPGMVDLAVYLAAVRYPGFIAPLLTGMHIGESNPAYDYYDPFLAAYPGWKGIGEIIVHGHGSNLHDEIAQQKLKDILTVAAAHGVPVLLHWDMGAVDAGEHPDSPAADNYKQFIELIDAVPDAVVVLAHCGLGPGNQIANDEPSYGLPEWKTRFTGDGTDPGMLSHPNLYFDVGGLQIGGVQQLMNEALTMTTIAGQFLLEQMATHPTRFMVGTDVETRSYFNQSEGESADHNPHTGVAEYVGSVSNYIAYLQYGVDNGIIDQDTMDRVRGWNAKEVYDF